MAVGLSFVGKWVFCTLANWSHWDGAQLARRCPIAKS